MQQDGFFNLRRNPHSAPRTVLLKVNLIQSPEVYVWLKGQLSKFFYAPLVEADQHGRRVGAVCAVGSPIAEKVAGTAERSTPLPSCAVATRPTSYHPRDSPSCHGHAATPAESLQYAQAGLPRAV